MEACGTSGCHLLQLINDVLDLSKVESGKFEFFPEPLELQPVVDDVVAVLAQAWERKAIRVEVDIEASPMTPGRYGVRGIPTMMLFKNGQMTSMKVGAMPKQKILEWLSEAGVSA